MGQVVTALVGKTQGTLPSNTKANPKEQIHAITTRIKVQLPEITLKRPTITTKKVSTMSEEHVYQLNRGNLGRYIRWSTI